MENLKMETEMKIICYILILILFLFFCNISGTLGIQFIQISLTPAFIILMCILFFMYKLLNENKF